MQLRKNIVSLVLAMQCLLNKRHFVSRILGIETKIYYDKHVIFGITVKVCFIFSSPVIIKLETKTLLGRKCLVDNLRIKRTAQPRLRRSFFYVRKD